MKHAHSVLPTPLAIVAIAGLSTPCLLAADAPFAEPTDISGGSVQGVTSLVAGDLDGDGRADVVVIEGGKHAGGRKTFAWFESPNQLVASWPRHDFGGDEALRPFLGAARLADMDGDDDLDLIVSSDMHSGDNKEADVYIFENPRPRRNAVDAWPMRRIHEKTLAVHHINDMEIADMDGDGRNDVICRSLEPNQIHLFFQNADGSFEQRAIDTELEQSEGLAVGDLDDDGLPDIAFTGVWLRSPKQPRSEPYERATIDANYASVNQNTKEAIEDIDGDGRLDLLIGPAEAYRGGKEHYLAWYRNTGKLDGDWERCIIEASTNNCHTVKLGDLDGDGDLDVLTGVPWSRRGAPKTIRIYFNDGAGHFSKSEIVTRGKGLYTGVIADVDGDGAADIIGQDSYSGDSRPWLYRNLRCE